MQAHSFRSFFILAKIVFYPKNLFTILYCCLLIIASIITMFSFQGAFKFLFQETQWRFNLLDLQSISWMMVESTGIEPVTSCLQGRRSPSWANPPYRVLFLEVVGQGLAFLRKSHGGCNSPPDCCQEPPFESILAHLPLELFPLLLTPTLEVY